MTRSPSPVAVLLNNCFEPDGTGGWTRRDAEHTAHVRQQGAEWAGYTTRTASAAARNHTSSRNVVDVMVHLNEIS